MADNTKIEWTDATWNPTRGCEPVSPGCAHCYAERDAARWRGRGQPYEGLVNDKGKWTGVIRLIEKHLEDPLKWKTPKRIFVNSMSDLFHPNLDPRARSVVWDVMERAPWHTFQVLTKWPQVAEQEILKALPNVWLGTSVENQHFADLRIPQLLRAKAAVRFISAEPLLGPTDIDAFLWRAMAISEIPAHALDDGCTSGVCRRRPGLDWVIVGGESGPKARPCDVAWIRAIVRQCRQAGVPVFVKQLGARVQIAESPLSEWPGWFRLVDDGRGRMGRVIALRQSKGEDMAEWPADLRIREFPKAA